MAVQITEFEILLRVKHTSQNGRNIQNTALIMFNQEFVECCKGLEKLKLGIHKENQQRHDNNNEEPPLSPNLFGPARYYCVETICASCGVVIAWTKFARSELPTNILQFLEDVYQNEALRPDYICIDKGCKVLQTAVSNGSWDRIWKHTTRIIVDTFHYLQHRVEDYLC
jgi:hypothetical protein